MREGTDTLTPTDTRLPKVLVCDDSKLVRLTAKKMLAARYDLLLAEDGEDGWKTLLENPDTQVIFTDLGMPNLDGFGLIERIRTCENEKFSQLPVIVITGAAEDESVKQRIFEVGATDFITKPFKATELIARAESHTHYHSTRQTLTARACIDAATEVLNQQGILDQLTKDKAFTQRHQESLAVCILGLDDSQALFKKLGQRTFDLVMKQIAKICSSELRKEDSIGRLKSDEFLLTLPMAKSQGVRTLAKRLCTKVSAVKLKAADETISLSLSVGAAAQTKGTSISQEDLLADAQTALNNSRAIGKGQIQFLHSETHEQQSSVISIDQLLATVGQGSLESVDEQFASMCHTLAPLIALLSDEQKQRLVAANRN